MPTAPLYTQSAPRKTRGLLAAIWRGLLQAYASNDSLYGVRIQDDFTKGRTISGTTSASTGEGWSIFESAVTGGTNSFSTIAGVGGIAELNSTGTANHQGAEAQWTPALVKLPTATADAQGAVAFQARFDPGDADTIFIGLSEAGNNFLSATSQLPTTSDYMGFYSEDAGATWKFKCANDNDGGTAATGSFTIPTADYSTTDHNNMGFRVNADKSLDLCVNDKWYGPAVHGIKSTALPIETLTLRLSVTAGGGTTAPTIQVDEVDCFVSAVN